MTATIMTKPDFAEVMFLVAFIIFVIAAALSLSTAVARPSWVNATFLMLAGLACLALGFLAL